MRVSCNLKSLIFIAAFGFRLGLPLLPDGRTNRCPLCGEGVDPFGDHLVLCKMNGPTRRHNAFRDAWASVFTAAGISFIKEASSSDGSRPADILLLSWDLGRDVAVDFTISHLLGNDTAFLCPTRKQSDTFPLQKTLKWLENAKL